MTETIEVEGIIPAPPEAVCAAFLDARTHGAMIGAAVTVDEATGNFTAWDGYIEGRTLEVEPGRRILQSWRSTDFPDEAADSRLELTFERAERGTRLRIVHSEIPFGQGPSYAEGWAEHYFAPMQRFFARASAGASGGGATQSGKRAAARPAKKSAKPAARVAETSAGTAKRRAGAAKKGARPTKQSAGPAKKGTSPAKKGTSPAKKGTSLAKKGTSPAKKSAKTAARAPKKPSRPAK